MFYIKHIKNEEHYSFLINNVLKQAKEFVWIGTADIKDLHIKKNTKIIPFLKELDLLIKKGINIRLIHAKEPGKQFIKDFDRFPVLVKNLERSLCIRVHFKIIIIDGKIAYTGSANLTGAAFGMRSKSTRNFESGIITNDPEFVESIMNQFDDVWAGKFCKKCNFRKVCPDPIIV